VSTSSDLDVRRVGFRNGATAELMALHAVEVPIQTERGSSRMPREVESYIAFARNLPAQFDDHAWLVEASDGVPVAAGFCWANAAGDPDLMECDVLVRRDRRREGIGRRLFLAICEQTAEEGRSSLTWNTFDAVPAGEAFSQQVEAQVARVNRTSELRLDAVDWSMLERWSRAPRARQLGYRLEVVVGVFPAHLRADAVRFHHIMQTAPREALDVSDVLIDVDFVAQLDWALVEAGRTRWTVLVRDRTGACVGGTEITFERDQSETVFQQNTGIDPAHRGLGLAKWAKAQMLERIRQERPEVRRVRSENAYSNAPMLGINKDLGFKTVNTRTEWQADVQQLLVHLR
jgi:mycothiol synthase